MARKQFIGNAAAVKQITTVTVGGTCLDGETFTLTMNTKDLVLTLVGNEATTAVATALKEMWMAATRLDGSGSTDVTSNAGGQQFGEFSKVTATVSGSVVTLTANKPGVPFVVTASETSATGTLTLATPQAATGPNFWDNGDNWNTLTVPANDDTFVLRDCNVPIWFGLPNGSLEGTFEHWMSHTGEVGLPPINIDDPSKPYYEYLQPYVRLDDAGTGTDIAHRWGMGEGPGSPLINVKHTGVKNSHIVYNTGRPHPTRLGTKALNLCSTGNTSTINILNGSVDFSSQDGSTAAFVTVKQSGGDTKCESGIHTSNAVITTSGGRSVIGGGAIAAIHVRGGVLRIEGQTGTITDLNILPRAIVEYASIATITTITVKEGTFDARPDAGPFTITNAVLYPGNWLDPYNRATLTNNLMVYAELSGQILLGGSNNDAIVITPP